MIIIVVHQRKVVLLNLLSCINSLDVIVVKILDHLNNIRNESLSFAYSMFRKILAGMILIKIVIPFIGLHSAFDIQIEMFQLHYLIEELVPAIVLMVYATLAVEFFTILILTILISIIKKLMNIVLLHILLRILDRKKF